MTEVTVKQAWTRRRVATRDAQLAKIRRAEEQLSQMKAEYRATRSARYPDREFLATLNWSYDHWFRVGTGPQQFRKWQPSISLHDPELDGLGGIESYSDYAHLRPSPFATMEIPVTQPLVTGLLAVSGFEIIGDFSQNGAISAPVRPLMITGEGGQP
jgi:hypothetical protein